MPKNLQPALTGGYRIYLVENCGSREKSRAIDNTIKRAMGKIGFNYFAYNFLNHGNFDRLLIYDKQFNEIRNFVLKGEDLDSLNFNMYNNSLVSLNGKIPQLHAITAESDENVVKVQVSLFNQFIYIFCMSNLYEGSHFKFGHYFCPFQQKIGNIQALQ